jgi:hypothetical protein
VPPAKAAHFAAEARVLDAADLGKVGEEKRIALLACLLHEARRRARDEVVSMFCKRIFLPPQDSETACTSRWRFSHSAQSWRCTCSWQRPELPLTVGLDGGYVHAGQRSRREGWFEVIAGKSVPTDRGEGPPLLRLRPDL